MIFVGTSGWQYDSWKGRFYPRGLPQSEWLEHYATRFPVVEVNNTFYRLPAEDTFRRWGRTSRQGFLFVVKASRYITHIRRLREAAGSVELFWSRARLLREKLGPVLFQLPPNFRTDAALLREFLSTLPKELQAAFEFRDDSWLNDQTLEALNGAGAAWVMADRPGWKVPSIVTGGWSYIRFHQGRTDHPAYARRKLRLWADRIVSLPSRETHVFFNNDALAAAPADAAALIDLLSNRGAEVATARA